MNDLKRITPARPRGARRLPLLLLLVAPVVIPASQARAQCPPPPNEPINCRPAASPTPAVPFQPDTAGPIRVRKSAFDLTPAEIDRLKRAFAALRTLARNSPNDPRGWLLQANVHCWYCGGGRNGARGEEIHFSYWFFPWHRAYLYFLERTLGQLVNDPTLALPYWDWDVPGRDRLPPPYVTPNNSTNPLFDRRRGVPPGRRMPAGQVNGTALERVLDAADWRAFLGRPPSPLTPTGGSLENGPHGFVHVWTGLGSIQNPCGGADMGIFSTAAQDPLFFAHHANIDRLWDVWLARDPGRHTNPPGAAWASHRWTFYDQNRRLVSISVADVAQRERSLRYRYQPPRGSTAPAAMAMAFEAGAMEDALGGAAGPATRLTREPQVVRVPVTAAARELMLSGFEAAPGVGAAPALGAAPPVYDLVIGGVTAPPGRSGTVRVFVNLPGATARTSTEDPHYVGYFTVVPHSTVHPTRTSVALELSPANRRVIADEADLRVTLVPVAGNEPPRAIDLSYESVNVRRREAER